mgnify:CR=1 FL=1
MPEKLVTLTVVGRDPSRRVRRLGRVEGVEIVGPADPRPYLAQAAVIRRHERIAVVR